MSNGPRGQPSLVTALLVVDVQLDFCPGGTLPVPYGDLLIPALNQAIRSAEQCGVEIFASRDWHPAESLHFDSYGGTWPVHCVAGTKGAEFHRKLRLPENTHIISKGLDRKSDGYSVFEGRLDGNVPFENALRHYGVTQLVVGGIATDYCVRCSVLDALRLGVRATLLTNAIAAVEANPGDGQKALDEMRRAGADLSRSDTVQWEPTRPQVRPDSG